MEISLDQIVLLTTTLAGAATTIIQAYKARKAEVRAQKAEIRAKEAEVQAKEFENIQKYIDNADAMVKLVMDANEKSTGVQNKLINELKTENEKFKKNTELFQQLIESIALCPYREQCPVYGKLQKSPTYLHRIGKGSNRNDPGGGKGHNNNS